jgi:hypothetical protein
MVYTGIHASNIVFEKRPMENDGPNFIAKGVEFKSEGKKHVVRADRG